MSDTNISRTFTPKQMDELIKQLKISNQIALATLLKDFALNPVTCRTDSEVKQWNDLLNEMVALSNHLGIERSCTDDE